MRLETGLYRMSEPLSVNSFSERKLKTFTFLPEPNKDGCNVYIEEI